MKEVNYDKLSREKRASVWWTAVSGITAIVFGVMMFTPMVGLLAETLLSAPRPFYSAVRVLAKELNAQGRHATGVRINDNEAAQCNLPALRSPLPNDEDMATSRLVITPVPTFTEFIISEEAWKICLAIYEAVYADTPNTPAVTKAGMEFDIFAYQDAFGTIPNPLVRLNTRQIDLSGAFADAKPLPNLREFYQSVPSIFFPDDQEQARKLMDELDIRYEGYINAVKNEIEQPKKTMSGILWLLSMAGRIGLMMAFLRCYGLYRIYALDMRSKGIPVLKFRHFVKAHDISETMAEILQSSRDLNRAENELRRTEKKLRMLEKQEAIMPSPKTFEDLEKDKADARRRKIETWCARLLEITPHKHLGDTERICAEAKQIGANNFDDAKSLLVAAINERKIQNEQEGYPGVRRPAHN